MHGTADVTLTNRLRAIKVAMPRDNQVDFKDLKSFFGLGDLRTRVAV